MVMWGIFWAVIALVLAGATVALSIYILLRLTHYRPPPTWRADLKRYGRTMGFWSFWGGIFGTIGSAVLMRFTGLSRQEALPWIIFGVTVGLIWGALWGVFWQLTSR